MTPAATAFRSTRIPTGDGTFDKHTTFVDGLNIATSVVRGRGGVWVLNPPYLLHYPDKDNDDVPDGDPVVHLQGFGMARTLIRHPTVCIGGRTDGCTVRREATSRRTLTVRDIKTAKPVYCEGPAIWRYHPETRSL